MRKAIQKAVKDSRSQRPLQLECLESRTLLSAVPWTPQASELQMLPREPLGTAASVDTPPSLTHALPTSYTMPSPKTTQPSPSDHRLPESLATQQMAPFNMPPGENVGGQTPPPSSAASEHGDSGPPPRAEWKASPTDSPNSPGSLSGMSTTPAYALPSSSLTAMPPGPDGMGHESAQVPLSTDWHGDLGPAPWGDLHEFAPSGERDNGFDMFGMSQDWLTPVPEKKEPLPVREFFQALAGIDLTDPSATSLSDTAVGSVSLADAWYNDSESLLQLSTEVSQTGFISLLTLQEIRENLTIAETPYAANRSSTLATEAAGGLRFSTVATLDSYLGAPLPTLASLGENPTSPLNDQNGGLVDIDVATDTLFSHDDSLSGKSQQPFSDQTPLSRIDWNADDEQLPDEDAERDPSIVLTDAAYASDQDIASEEGGMIELAAAHSGNLQVYTSAPLSSPSVPRPLQDIQIDEALGRFRALEVAETTSEDHRDPSLAQQAGKQDLPTAANASESTVPAASASAANEPHAETDHHAAVSAIVGLSLMSGTRRENSEKSLTGDPHKARNVKRTTG